MALIFLAGVSYVSAQDFAQQNQEVVIENVPGFSGQEAKAELGIGYSQGGSGSNYGYSCTANVPTFQSACILFTAPQMLNYVGGTLHTIETRVSPATSIADLTSYSVWIKNALDGAIVYEQDIPIADLQLGTRNNFVLTTPYTITNAPLVLGFTAGFTVPTTASRFPLSVETQYAPYPIMAYNGRSSTVATSHGAGATWGSTGERAANIWGHITGTDLPVKDLAAPSVSSFPLKWVGKQNTYTVTVFNAGSESQNNYTVQLIDAANTVLSSQTVTTAIAAGAFASVNLDYTPATVGNLAVRGKVVLSGDENAANDISVPVTYRIYPMQPMAYCSDEPLGGFGNSTATNRTYSAAIDYSAADMIRYAGQTLTAIEVGIYDASLTLSNCTVWIKNVLTGDTLHIQPFTPVTGWNIIELTTPFTLQNENTYIGYTLTAAAAGYPLGTTPNTQNQIHGGHYSAGGAAWTSLCNNGSAGNFAIIGVVEPNCAPATNLVVTYNNDCTAGLTWTAPASGTFTYNIYRNGILIGTTTTTSYTDSDNTPAIGNTWMIRVACGDGSESVPAIASMAACGLICHPATNLVATYKNDCTANLTWASPTGSYTTANGTITTPAPNTGSGVVAFDIIAGAQDVTLTEVDAYFAGAGTAIVHVYYREGTACGHALNPEGWMLVGQVVITVSVANGLATFPIPGKLTIPAGQTYGIYMGTFGSSTSPGRMRYLGATTTCSTTVSATNSDLTIMGGHGMSGIAAPFTGTAYSERCFAGTIRYTVPGGAGNTYNVYRDDTQIGTITTSGATASYTDAGNNPEIGNTWKVTAACNATLGESAPITATLAGGCEPVCEPPTNLTAEYESDYDYCEAILNWVAPETGKAIIHPIPPRDPNHVKPAKGQRVSVPQVATHRPANMQTAAPMGKTLPLLGASKGNTARAVKLYPNPQGYISFDVDNVSGATIINSTAPVYNSGDCVDGVLYAWGNADNAGNFYKINSETGTITQTILGAAPESCTEMAYDYNTSTMYGYRSGVIYTINLETGARTQVATTSYSGNMFAFAINTTGQAYGVGADGNFYSINKASGACTVVGATGQTDIGYVQSMNFDHNTDILYWAHSGEANDWFRTINISTGAATLLAPAYEMCSFHVPYTHGTPCATISNLTVNVTGHTVSLTWTAAPGSPTGYQILRNNVVINTVTTTSYTDNGVADGQYVYGVKALFNDTCIPKTISSPSTIVGDWCNIKIVMEDGYGDGWNGAAINIKVNGGSFGTATISSGSTNTVNTLIPSGTVELSWTQGTLGGIFDDECSFVVYNSFDEVIFTCAEGDAYDYPAGFVFATYYNDCNPRNYNVYRDGEFLAMVDKTSYKDLSFDAFLPHTWEITALCDDGESPRIAVTLDPCKEHGDCDAPEQLTIEYASDCTVNLEWISTGGQTASYNVYRDGELIAKEHVGTTYTDFTHDSYEGHEWCVTEICPNGWESEATCASMLSCANNPCVDATVGSGIGNNFTIPANNWYNYSYVQEIFDASEVSALAGELVTAISFEYQYTAACTKSLTIYMGTTTQSTFTPDPWVPISDLQQVFTGSVTFNNANLWATIELQTPFAYTGGNIVIAINNTTGAYPGNAYVFKTHEAIGKSRHIYKDTPATAYDPANPGAGSVLNYRNNVLFQSCEKIENDMEAVSIIGMSNPVVNVSYPYTVTIKNNGIAAENDYLVKVLTSNNILLAQVQGPVIAPGETRDVTIMVSFTEDMIGALCIKGNVSLETDQFPVNNSSSPFCFTIKPYAEDDIIDIPANPWAGTLNKAIPFQFYYYNGGAQSVYLNSEMGIAGGIIKSLSWFYNNTGSAINNYPVKVYLANSGVNALGGAWLPESAFTLVYEGNVSVPMGMYQLTIDLAPENWFLYTGQSLVVTTERMYMQPYVDNVTAFTTGVSPVGRTMQYQSDSSPFSWSGTNSLSTISNLELVVQRVPYGVLKGTVTDCTTGAPLSGISITMEQYGITVVTDASGNYTVPFLPVGESGILSATKYLYYDFSAASFTVEEGGEYTYDYCMALRDKYVAYGVVQAADGTYIEDATLTLKGYVDYGPITSGANGVFEFLDVVWAPEYTLTVTADGYQKHTSTHDVLGHTSLGTIIMYDVTYPPGCVEAKEVEKFAEITWCEPDPNSSCIFRYDDGTRIGHLGFNPGDQYSVMGSAHRVPTTLTSMSWYLSGESGGGGPHATVNLWILALNASGAPTANILFNKANHPNVDESWNTYEFETPIECPNGFFICASYVGFVGVGTDSGTDPEWPFVPNTHYYAGDFTSGTFSTFESAGFSVSPMLRAEGTCGKSFGYTTPAEPVIATGPAPVYIQSETPVYSGDPYSQSRDASKGILGYKLWRLLPGQEDKPELWSTLTNTPLPALVYTDYTWQTASAGTHKWAVRTVYHGMGESKAAFSNTLVKVLYGDCVVNVSTNSGDLPAGAVVTLGTQTATVAVNTVSFSQIAYGTYPLKVTLEGYQDYTAQITINALGVAHTAMLIEIIKLPFDLKTEETECNTIFSWDHDGGKKLMYFDIYLDGKLRAEGVSGHSYIFTGLPIGDYVAGVAAHYSSGYSAIVTTPFSVTCVGIDEIEGFYRIYPNPTSEYLTIERTNSTLATIDLYNAMGMHIANYETGSSMFDISVTNLAAGTYFIRVTEGNNTSVKSFVKKN